MDLLVELAELGYTDALIRSVKLKKLFYKCGFNMLVPHVFVDAAKNWGECTKDFILNAPEEEMKRPPLQRNTIYFYCGLSEFKDGVLIIKDLKREYKDAKTFTITLPDMGYYETYYNPLPFEVQKNLIFKLGGKEVGWYNKATNILWISDIGYTKATAIDNIKEVLTQVAQYKTKGEIAILPNLTIGADPEFEIFDSVTKTFIPANQIFQDDPRGNPREIGHDGHPETGEIRPQYADNPIKLATNIKRTVKKMIAQLANNNPQLDANCGGGLNEMLGGHIHFNIPISGDMTEVKHILYDLIGCHVRDCMSNDSARKEHNHYMHRDADDSIRKADKYTGFEWRLLPSFILNEEICRAVLCTTWCVIKEIYGGGLKKNAYRKDETEEILKSLALYPYYKKYIDKFVELFIASRTSMEGKSLKESWKVNPRVATLRINTDIDWVRKYFVPVNLKLVKPVRIGIFRGDALVVLYYKAPPSPSIIEMLQDFCDRQLLEFHAEKDTANPNDMALYIPYKNPRKPDLAFSFFRPLLIALLKDLNERNKEIGQ